jgi:hypothetical protein
MMLWKREKGEKRAERRDKREQGEKETRREERE